MIPPKIKLIHRSPIPQLFSMRNLVRILISSKIELAQMMRKTLKNNLQADLPVSVQSNKIINEEFVVFQLEKWYLESMLTIKQTNIKHLMKDSSTTSKYKSMISLKQMILVN